MSAVCPARLALLLLCSWALEASSHEYAYAVGEWRAVNRSRPARHSWRDAHQCRGEDDGRGHTRLGERLMPFRFAAVRAWSETTASPGATAVVVIVCSNGTSPLGARGASEQARLLFDPGRLERWHRHMLQPHNMTLLLLLARHYTVPDLARARAYGTALGLRPVECAAGAEPAQCARARLLALDEGYELYSYSTADAPTPSYVLVGVVTLPDPDWARALPSGSLAEWRTPHCNHARYAYVQSNNYYVHTLFRLRVLDLFDFFIKVDTDVQVLRRLPSSPAFEMRRRRALFAFTSRWPYYDNAGCARGLNALLDAYLANESALCAARWGGPGEHARGAAQRVVAAAENTAWWVTEKVAFYGNFVAGWLGFWASPEVLHFSAAWDACEDGQWVHRWTDQQYWHRALGLVSGGPEAWVDLSRWRQSVFCHKRLCNRKALDATHAARRANARRKAGRSKAEL